jgi:SAM-dependent methyltransferase
MDVPRRFDDLLAEAEAAPLSGWDFSWLDGRATEERPSWGYAASLALRLGRSDSALDIETGGGEVFGEALAGCTRRPRTLAATESWAPNLALARRRLRRFGVTVEEVGDAKPLPFEEAQFDLVASRHPTVVPWSEIARVLTPSGTFFAQLIGAGSNRELTEFLMGPRPVGDLRTPERALADAAAAGLVVEDLRDETLRVVFDDVGAVAYFLRKVVWTVPGFTVEGYRAELLRLHGVIEREGRFVSHSRRLLVEARRPEEAEGERGGAVRDL